jgi:hypothetical protein
MILSTVVRRSGFTLLLSATILGGASCGGGADDRPEVGGQLETRDAAAGTGGTGAGGTGAGDSGPVDPGPCGKQFEACCESSGQSCSGADLSCNDSACVSCSSVPSARSGCTNVALRGTATAVLTRAPDQQAPDYGPRLAIDGNVCNVWASGDYAVNPETGLSSTWFEVDLGAAFTLSSMTLWLAMTPAGSVELSVEHSMDHSGWQTLWDGPRAMSGHAPWLHDFPAPVAARYVRVSFTASPSWISIRELALFQCS